MRNKYQRLMKWLNYSLTILASLPQNIHFPKWKELKRSPIMMRNNMLLIIINVFNMGYMELCNGK